VGKHFFSTYDIDSYNLVDKVEMVVYVVSGISSYNSKVFDLEENVQLLKRSQVVIEEIPHMKVNTCIF